MKTQTAMQTRRMVKSDLEAIADIERNSFSFDRRWGDRDFRTAMKERHAFVAFWRSEVAGYMVYKTDEDRIEVERLAVDSRFRGQGVGRTMLEMMWSKIGNRHEAWFEIPEEMLSAQLWLKSCGWRCECIVESAACEGQWYRFAVGVE